MSARPVGPPSWEVGPAFARSGDRGSPTRMRRPGRPTDRKSTRLNSSHSQISYAVFCLKKKKEDHPDLHMVHSDKESEMTWRLAPACMWVLFAVVTTLTMFDTHRPSPPTSTQLRRIVSR